jgi:SAM-dependent methyltransferase
MAAGGRPPGTAGYDEAAEALSGLYESVAFEEVHRDVLHLIPSTVGEAAGGGGRPRALDVGAGTGRDAAALAARGFEVVAVEPTPGLRERGRRLHPSPRIAWLDDALPDLPATRAPGLRFDLILLTAVWMHLDAGERGRAMAAVAGLLAPGGRAVVTLRHGPVPEGRRMFEVGAAQTAGLARAHGLATIHSGTREDMLGRPDIRWSVLAFAAPGPGPEGLARPGTPL